MAATTGSPDSLWQVISPLGSGCFDCRAGVPRSHRDPRPWAWQERVGVSCSPPVWPRADMSNKYCTQEENNSKMKAPLTEPKSMDFTYIISHNNQNYSVRHALLLTPSLPVREQAQRGEVSCQDYTACKVVLFDSQVHMGKWKGLVWSIKNQTQLGGCLNKIFKKYYWRKSSMSSVELQISKRVKLSISLPLKVMC